MNREEIIFEIDTLLLLLKEDEQLITAYYEEKVAALNLAVIQNLENQSFFSLDRR